MASQKSKEYSADTEKPSSSTGTSANKPYIEWIHCNICYEQYKLKTRNFYLLACDHVVCEQCTVEVKESTVNGPIIFKCPLCRQKTRGCKMGNTMPPNLKELFHPEPYLDGLNGNRIIAFHEKHHYRFLDYLERQSSIIQELKQEAERDRENAQKSYQRLEEHKRERKHLEKRIVAIKIKRKEMEEQRSSSSNSLGRPGGSASTSNSSNSLGPRMPRPNNPIVNHDGVTSFAQHTSNHSFFL